MENKEKNNEKKIIFGISIIIVGVLLALLMINKIGIILEGKAIEKIEEQEKYYELLVDNCECVEHERRTCLEGFELSGDEKFCVNENGDWSLVRLKCSRYDCNEEEVSWSFEDEVWEPRLDFK